MIINSFYTISGLDEIPSFCNPDSFERKGLIKSCIILHTVLCGPGMASRREKTSQRDVGAIVIFVSKKYR